MAKNYSPAYSALREEFNNLRHIIFGFREEVNKEKPAIKLPEVMEATKDSRGRIEKILSTRAEEFSTEIVTKIKDWFKKAERKLKKAERKLKKAERKLKKAERKLKKAEEKLKTASDDSKKYCRDLVEKLRLAEISYQEIRKEIFS